MRRVFLGDIANFINGRAFRPDEWDTQGLPIIRIQNLTGSSQHINYYRGKIDKKHLVRKGDILISWSASLGVYMWPGSDAVLNQHIFKVVLKDTMDKKYFYYAASEALNEMILQVHGSTMQHITKEPFESILIPFPSLKEQKYIASLLEKADRLRRLQRYALEFSNTYLQSVFLEMFGDPGKNPKKWPTGQLHKLCSQTVDCPHSTPIYSLIPTAYACIRSSDIQNGVLDWSTTKHVDFSEYEKRVRTLIPMPNDVVYCREGARFGNAAVIPNTKKVCLGQRMMLFRAASSVATPEFIWAFLESESTYREACRLAGGSASPHLNVGDIKEFITIIPPIALQQEFSKIVQKYERLRAQQREAERQAEHLFQTLLHQAFQGELTSDLVEVPVPSIEIDIHQRNGHVGTPADIDLSAYQMALQLE
jgi:type I restriction enzyme S subunit